MGGTDSPDFPRVSLRVEVVRVDAQKVSGLADGFLVAHPVQTHEVPLAQPVVVFQAETIVLAIRYDGDIHGRAGTGLAWAATNAAARSSPSATSARVRPREMVSKAAPES